MTIFPSFLPPRPLQPLPEPSANREFANRQAELQLIEDKLYAGRQGRAMPLVVTCFWGTHGLGKSWLLREIERLYTLGTPKSAGRCATIVARLDLDRRIGTSYWSDNKLDTQGVVLAWWQQLAEQANLPRPTRNDVSGMDWANRFVQQVTTWATTSYTPILMLDTMEDVVRNDEDAFFELEAAVIEKLALLDRVLFVCASRGPLRRWRRFQVRRRVDLYPLQPFDDGAVGKAVAANPAVSKTLRRHAFGHPITTEFMARLLEQRGLNLAEASAQDVEKALRADNSALIRRVVGDATQHILLNVPEALRDLARTISVLRWINVEPLRAVMEDLNLRKRTTPDADYLDLIGQLQTHHLLYWNVDAASYEFNPALRHLLARSLQLEDPGRFRQAHRAAYLFHRQHLNRYPQYLERYLLQTVYHAASLAREDGLEARDAFLPWFERFCANNERLSAEAWQGFLNALRVDRELRDILPPQSHEYRRLRDEAKKRAEARKEGEGHRRRVALLDVDGASAPHVEDTQPDVGKRGTPSILPVVSSGPEQDSAEAQEISEQGESL